MPLRHKNALDHCVGDYIDFLLSMRGGYPAVGYREAIYTSKDKITEEKFKKRKAREKNMLHIKIKSNKIIVAQPTSRTMIYKS